MKTTDGQLPLGLAGQPNIRNKGALNWSPNGLAAIGCGTDIVVLDTKNLNVIANLSAVHKSSVAQVLWNPFGRPFLPEKPDKQPPDLVSVDTSGFLVTWDVEKSQSIATFAHPDSKTLLDMKWANGFDMAQKSKVFMLYASNTLAILDVMGLTYQSIQLMDSVTSPLEFLHFGFDVDPYVSTYCTNLALLAENSISFVQNWDPLKVKQEKLIISSKMVLQNRGTSPGPSPISIEQSKRHNSTSGIRKLVSDIVGADYPLIPGQPTPKPEGTILYHPNLKDHLIVYNSNQILFISTYFKAILYTFVVDRNTSPLLQVIPTKQRPALITLHDNGIIYLRKFSISGLHNLSVSLETVCCSDQPRFSSKKAEILGIVLDPKFEKSALLHLIDGRYVQYDITAPVKSSNTLETQTQIKKHLMTPITPTVSLDGFVPSENTKLPKSATQEKLGLEPLKKPAEISNRPLGELLQNILEQEPENGIQIKLKKATPLIGSLTCIRSRPNQNLLVAGTSQGFIIVFKIVGYYCEIVKRYSAHSNSPVCGIEFISEEEIISFANLSFSANPKCEMIITHLWTGAMKSLKQDDPFHIGFVRVSPLRQYFILAYKNGMAPCELWDVPRRQLIKTLPSKLPSITCATWKKSSDTSKDETFFMTDLGTFLFTFRVDGNRFSSATCVKLDTAGNTGGVPVSLISKGKLVFRGDSSGTLVIYDTEKKTASSGVSIGRGPLLKIEAGHDAYDNLFIAQFNEQVELWDLMEVKKVRSLYNGRNFKAADACWLNGYLATIPRNTGGIKFLSIEENQKQVTSPPLLSLTPSFLPSEQKCEKLLHLLKSMNNEAIFDFFEEIGAHDESKLWSIFLSSLKSNRGWASSDYGFNLFSDNKSFKDSVVKIAQSVWFADIEKREDVAKVLLWTGEAEKAAEILLDTEPSGAVKYIANGMKAGLCVGSTHLPEATKAVLKIIATNLIACGEIDEGLELLCLLSKHSEAVKYLESSNDWSRAILLSKTSLNEKQAHETLAKYGQYLNTHRHVIRSACVYASIGKYDRTIEVLFGGRKRHLSYLLVTYCDKHAIELSNLSTQVRLAIRLDFARFIFECGLMKEALHFCDVIGEDAKDLKAELEILSA